jgi:hypothetical protein
MGFYRSEINSSRLLEIIGQFSNFKHWGGIEKFNQNIDTTIRANRFFMCQDPALASSPQVATTVPSINNGEAIKLFYTAKSL